MTKIRRICDYKVTTKKKNHLFLTALVIAWTILATGCLNNRPTPPLPHKVTTFTPTSPLPNHFSGGFGINTPEKAAKAASDGVQVAFLYNYSALSGSPLERALKSLNMRVVDAFISSELYRYQRHYLCMTRKVNCSASYVNKTEDAIYASIRAHLQKVAKIYPLVLGYWVLDDQIDASLYGALKQILRNIHKMIQQYTPGVPAICGFGAELKLNYGDDWHPGLASDFSPQGCDIVGLYIYASATAANAVPPATSYDWTMARLLPEMFTSLRQQGWNITKTPFIGIGHAWGMHTKDGNFTTLTSQSMETQSRSFCEHGATGLVFYGWADSSFEATTQTPMNSPEIEAGIRDGIATCKQYWSKQLQP